MMHHYTKMLFLFILGVCLLTSNLQAQAPDLIGIGNIANGDIKSGVFEIDGVVLDPEAVSKVAVKVGNGPWQNAEGIGTWKYTVDSRQIVTGSSYTYDSATGRLVKHYQLGPYYGALDITIGAFDKNGNQVATKTLTVNIAPEPPHSDIASGSYDSPINVILKAAPGLSIYYTLDGTDPKVNGVLYCGSIYVAQSTVINAVTKTNNNQYSDLYTLNLTVTGGTAQPSFTIQYYYDEALTKPLPDSPYLKAGIYYLKIISNKKLTGNPQLSIKTPGTLNNVNQVSALPLSDGVYYYPRVITADSAATGDSQETITLSGTDIYGNQVQSVAPLNANTKAAYIDTQPPSSGSIGVEGYALSTNNPMPYFLINSNGSSQMRLALNEADLSTATWVDYTNRYGGFDISNGGSGLKTVWIEFKDRARNVQPQHVYTILNYDNSALSLDIEYYSDPALTHSLGQSPYLNVGTYYLKITANQDLDSNTVFTVNIDAEGINNDVTNKTTTRITNRVYYCIRTIVNDPAAIGNTKESIKVMGITPSNTDTMAAYTCTSVLTPGTPTITLIAANQLTVSWTAVTRATAYEVWYGTSNDNGSAIKYGSDVTSTSCTITGLTNGATYFIWLRAKNNVGTSDFSPPASGTVIPDIPAPTVIAGTNQLTVTWPVVTGATAYEIWYSTTNNSNSALKFGNDITGTSCTITGLTDGTSYFVWLKIITISGTSDFSASASGTTAPGEPAAPSIIAGNNQITVSWAAVTGATSYEVWYNTVNDTNTVLKFNSVGTSCVIMGLPSGTVYFVWIKAKNSAGVSRFSPCSSQIVIPDIPVPVVTANPNQLTITWAAVAGASAYEVWYGTVNNVSLATKYSDVLTNKCIITGLTNDTTYYIWLKAKNSGGTSGFSAVVTGVPKWPGYITGYVNFTSKNSNDKYSVILVDLSKTLTYTASASFMFIDLPPGNYHIRIERAGYSGIIKEVYLAEDATADLGTLNIDNSPLPDGSGYQQNTVTVDTNSTYSEFTYSKTVMSATINYSLTPGNTYPAPIGSYTSFVFVEKSPTNQTISGQTNNSLSNTLSGTKNLSNLAPGTYYLSIYVVGPSNGGSRYSYATLTSKTDNGAPAISLSETWCNSTQTQQIYINCSDSVSGTKSTQYCISDSLTKPTNFNGIFPQATIQISTKGIWYLHVRCTDNFDSVNYQCVGPFIIQ
jgi:hypothetical protein